MESEDAHMASETSEHTELQKTLKKKLMGPTILDSFTKLTSDAEKLRIGAGINLLKHLNAVDSIDKKESELTYTLDRLVRGVGSSKSSAKTGFYSVLVALLTKTTLISVEDVLNATKKHLSTAGSNSKGENADICMGQILVSGALIHSGMFFTATNEEQLKIVEILITAGKKRSYLSLATYTFLAELIEKSDEKQFKPLWISIKDEVLKPWQEQTLDTIYLLLVCKEKFPSILKNKVISGILEVPDIVHEQSIKHLCEILLNIPSLSSLKHPVYEKVAKNICANESNLIKPWCVAMDHYLQKLNRNKHIIAATMLTSFLENSTDSSIVPDLLTVNFITSTIQTFKHFRAKEKDDEFYSKMDKFFKALSQKLQSEEIPSKVKISVLKKLLFYPGIFIFEKVTRTKIVQQITLSLNAEGVKSLAKLYCDVATAKKQKIAGNDRTENWINADRVYSTQLVVKLMGHSSVQKENEWRLDQLKFLLKLGLFKEDENISVGTELAAAIKDSFYHALDQRLPKLEDLRNILSSIVHYINENIFESSTSELRNNLSDDGVNSWSEMIQLVKKLESKTKFKHSYAIPVFHTLLLHMGLQLFSDFEMAQNSLKELHSCFVRLETAETPKKRKLMEGTIEEHEPVWIEVVVDLFLSLLSHNSHLLRSVIGCVFPYLCPHLTITGIRQILDVLDPKNEDNPLLKTNEDDDGDSEEEDSNDEESNSEDSEVDYIESDSEGNDQQETTTDKLRLAVREALHKSGFQTDDESEDMDNMDEEEGNRLDKALAEAFKLVKKNNKGKKNNKQTKDDKALTHFRVRVLDLIEIYLESEPSMLQCLEIACLLLQTLEFSIRDVHQKPLECRIRTCLKKITGLKKFSSNSDVTEDILSNMLQSFLDKGSRSAFIYQDMGDIIAECCMFIIRCSQMIEPLIKTPKKSKKHSKIEDIFKRSLETYFNKRDCLLPLPLFKNALQLIWNGNWLLLPLLIEFAFKNDIRPFRRGQALELLNIFYTNARFRNTNIDEFKKRIGPLETTLSNQAISLFQQLATNVQESKVKEKFVCNLLTLLSSVKLANASTNINWNVIGESVREYRSHVTLAKDAKKAYNKLCRTIGVSNFVKMQLVKQTDKADNKGDDSTQESENDDSNAAIKNKRKKNKSMNDKQKLKKEARLLRLKASSEGLSNEFAFSNVALSNIKIEESDEEASDDDLHKKQKLKMNKQNVTANSNQSSRNDEIAQNEQPKKKKLKKIKKQILNGNSTVTETTTNKKVKKNKKKRNHSESDSPNKKKSKT